MISQAKNKRPNSSRPTRTSINMGMMSANSTMLCALLAVIRFRFFGGEKMFIRIPLVLGYCEILVAIFFAIRSKISAREVLVGA
jgi:hypothetical protein